MSYTFECPFCSAKIDVPDELDNTSAQCPACGQEIYLTRDDAVEDLDPAVESMRREHEEKQARRMNELRTVMRDQEQRRQSGNVIKWLIYIFIVFPVAFWLLWLFIAFIYGCFSGKL